VAADAAAGTDAADTLEIGVVVVVGLHHIVESHILVVEDKYQLVVVGTRKAFRAEPLRLVVNTVVIVVGSVEGIVELDMVMALDLHQRRDWVLHW